MDRHREFTLGDWQVTPLRGVLHRGTESRRLTPKSMDVLMCLVRHKGDVVERETLLEEVWHGRAQTDEPLNKCIAEIRRQLGDDRGAPEYVETIPKRGYRLVAKVRPLGKSAKSATADRPAQERWLRVGAALLLIAGAIFFAARFSTTTVPPSGEAIPIAVMPFEVRDSGEGRQYFADGIHEELIGALSRSRSLTVRSRRSTLDYRGTGLSIPEIGTALGVDVIVEGSVRHAGDRVRVTAQLVDAKTDLQLWSGNFEESLTVADIFGMQNRIAEEISAALEVTLTAPGDRKTEAVPTANLEAYDHFMLGKYHYRRGLPGDSELSVKNFEAAVRLDPKFADAWDWLAYAYNDAATTAGHMTPHEAYPKARVAALRALEIRPDLATAMSILGYIRAVYDWDWVGAERDLRRAVELSPGDTGTVWSLAHVLAMIGRHDEAIELTKELVTRNPGIGRRHREVANRLIDAGRYDEALQRLAQAAERGAEQSQIYDTTGVALIGKGDIEGAIEQFEKAVDAKQRATPTIARLAYAYGRGGRIDEARALLDELLERSEKERVSHVTLATAYAGLGEQDLALDHLERAAESRDRAVLIVPMDPLFSDLAGNERFAALVATFAIPERDQ